MLSTRGRSLRAGHTNKDQTSDRLCLTPDLTVQGLAETIDASGVSKRPYTEKGTTGQAS